MNINPKIFWALLLQAVIFGSPACAQEDYLSYRVPASARRVGPAPLKPLYGKDLSLYTYLLPGDLKTGDFRKMEVATEIYQGKSLIEQDLFKDGVRYGVTRKWYPNGQLKSETPFLDGLMDGVVKCWDENGNLVGRYVMERGTGTAIEYDSNGLLVHSEKFKENAPNGLEMTIDSGGRYLIWNDPGETTYLVYGFYLNGELQAITDQHHRNGIIVEFKPGGDVDHITYWLKKQISPVEPSEYAAAAEKAGGMVRFFSDPQRYRIYLSRGVKDEEEYFRHLPLVKIPLQFDRNGIVSSR